MNILSEEQYPINIPYGYCHCGCGQKTKPAQITDTRWGNKKGEPQRFVIGHSTRDPLQILYGIKRCITCNKYKDVSFFSPHSKKLTKDGRISYNAHCKSCRILENLSHEKATKKRQSARRTRLERYGLTHDEYDNMIQQQQNRCLICQKTFENEKAKGRHPAVDHCHTTGVVRGILCGLCNRALGGFGDNVECLQAAILYLQKHEGGEPSTFSSQAT